MNSKKLAFFAALVFAGFVFGLIISGNDTGKPADETEITETQYTCSMHPQIRQDEPGTCPICGMDLVRLGDAGEPTGPSEIRLSENAAILAQVETRKVTSRIPEKEIRMNGVAEPDETRKVRQSAHFPGRIEELLINYTGQQVRRGQTIAYVYSPELVSAQRELLDALEHREQNSQMHESAKRKLEQWKLTQEQIRQIEESGNITRNFPVQAEHTGYVEKLNARQGDYIQTGSTLFEIATPDRFRVYFEAYEEDMPWIHPGDTISFTFKALPGQTFQAPVEYIDPYIDRNQRVSRVRVTLNRPAEAIRAGMFATGYVQGRLNHEEKIVVPRSAVLWTGKKSIVYVQNPDADDRIYQLRLVTLGHNLGDYFVVEDGIEIGEQLVVHGTFRIDASAQLSDKASMMRQHIAEELQEYDFTVVDHRSHVDEEFQAEMDRLFAAYISLSDALADEETSTINDQLEFLKVQLGEMPEERFHEEMAELWHEHRYAMLDAIEQMQENEHIEDKRTYFEKLSEALKASIQSFGVKDANVYIHHCPMAFNDAGADWLYDKEEIYNPYFGEVMLRCGIVKEQLNP